MEFNYPSCIGWVCIAFSCVGLGLFGHAWATAWLRSMKNKEAEEARVRIEKANAEASIERNHWVVTVDALRARISILELEKKVERSRADRLDKLLQAAEKRMNGRDQ